MQSQVKIVVPLLVGLSPGIDLPPDRLPSGSFRSCSVPDEAQAYLAASALFLADEKRLSRLQGISECTSRALPLRFFLSSLQ